MSANLQMSQQSNLIHSKGKRLCSIVVLQVLPNWKVPVGVFLVLVGDLRWDFVILETRKKPTISFILQANTEFECQESESHFQGKLKFVQT